MTSTEVKESCSTFKPMKVAWVPGVVVMYSIMFEKKIMEDLWQIIIIKLINIAGNLKDVNFQDT